MHLITEYLVCLITHRVIFIAAEKELIIEASLWSIRRWIEYCTM